MWNLVFLFTGLIFIVLLLVIFLSKQRIKSKENKVFLILSILNLIGFIIEISLQIFVRKCGINYFIIDPLSKLYIMYIFVWFSIFSIYTFLISNSDGTIGDYDYKLIKYTHIVVIVIGVAVISIMPIEKYYSNNEMYSYGMATSFLKIMLGAYIIVWLIRLLCNFKAIKQKKYYSIIITIILLLANVIIQTINPTILIATFTMTYTCYILFFTIENPDIKMAKDLAYSKKIVEDSRDKTMEMLDFMSLRLKKLLNNMNNIDSLDTDDPKEIKKEFKSIQKQYLELTDDISGLIDLGKIESGYLELNKNEYLTSDLSEDIKKILSYSYKRQKLKTTIEFDTDIPPVLYGDKEKVEQMFLYTYEYLVEIIKQGKLEIKVDTIKVNNLCKLKFIFHSIDTNIPSEESVENIKYLKVKKLAELINAKFKYSDNNILELSIIQKVKDPYKLLTQEMDNTNIKYFNAQDKRVLIITNKIMDTKELKLLLEPYHIEADSSRTFEEAKEKMLGDTTYDLIFIDDIIENKYIMRKNPYEIKFLKKFAGYEFKCIIMLRKRFADEYDYYFEKGYDDYIVKPIDKKSLDNILIKYLKNK